MRPSLPLSISVLVFGLLAVPASACEFLVKGTGETPRSVTFDTIADGIVSGLYRCGAKAYPALVWTLPVDGKQKSLGIRDDRLVDTKLTGPLGQLLVADVEDHVRLTILERAETMSMSRSPVPKGWFRFQRFFTFCDAGAADPLD